MLIQEITREESLKLLARMHLGRLACAQGTQPYVTPVYFAYDDHYHLYSSSTAGQKIDWMRANPLVCVEMDEVVSFHDWVSIIIFGRYEELLDTSDWTPERAHAYELLQRIAMWWEPAYAKTIVSGVERPLVSIFYRIQITQITGHRATPDSPRGIDARAPAKEGSIKKWPRKLT